MQKEVFEALNILEPWFTSTEFGRIALNGGFELTVRDRLLEPLHTIINNASVNDSIVSEYSKHEYKYQHLVKGELKNKSLRADMAQVEDLLSTSPECKSVIELKANFSSQFHSDIKKRTQDDYNKWFPTPPAAQDFPKFHYYYLHIIVEITDPKTLIPHSYNPSMYFPKYQNAKNKEAVVIQEIQNYFNSFSAKNNCNIYAMTDPSIDNKNLAVSPAFISKCSYPNLDVIIKTHFFLLEKFGVKSPAPLNHAF